MNIIYTITGIILLLITCHIGMRLLYPWLDEMPHRPWMVFASACGIAGIILITYALINTFGWLGTSLFILSGVAINIKNSQVVNEWANPSVSNITFDHNDNRDRLDEAP